MSEEFGPPIVVGGLGGSGTRVIAQMLERLGFFMGDDLNHAHDNMTLARQFHTMRDAIQELGPVGGAAGQAAAPSFPAIVPTKLREFGEAMRMSYFMQERLRSGWGFKVPGTHFVLPYLADVFPGLSYVHVVRHGIDMAFSSNQNQLHNWGRHYGVEPNSLRLERASLAFWVAANRHALSEVGRLGMRHHIVNFDNLCLKPRETTARFLEFLARPHDELEALLPLIKTPESLGRRAGRDLSFVGEQEWSELQGFDFHRDYPATQQE
jgi:hypothetical protein